MITIITTYSTALMVSALLAFAFGMIWYHPRAFGTIWAAEQPHRKMPDDYQKDQMKVMVSSACDALLFSTMALVLLVAYGRDGILLLAVAVSVGIYTNTAAKGGSNRLFLIDAGFLLSQLLIITSAIIVMSG